jgi:hypothetical protein
MIEKEFEERNSSRSQTFVARVEAKIRKHDATSVCDSRASPASAAIAPTASFESEAAPEFQNLVQTHNSNLASLAASAAVSEYHWPIR